MYKATIEILKERIYIYYCDRQTALGLVITDSHEAAEQIIRRDLQCNEDLSALEIYSWNQFQEHFDFAFSECHLQISGF